MNWKGYKGYPYNILIYDGQIVGRPEWAVSVKAENLPIGTLWRARSGHWYQIVDGPQGNLLRAIADIPEEVKALLLLSGDPLIRTMAFGHGVVAPFPLLDPYSGEHYETIFRMELASY